MTFLPVLTSRIRPLLLLAPLFSLPAEALTLANDQWRIELDPATLAAEAVLPSGKHLLISSPGPRQPVTALQQEGERASWLTRADGEVRALARLEGNRLILTLSRASAGELVWPRVPADVADPRGIPHSGYAHCVAQGAGAGVSGDQHHG